MSLAFDTIDEKVAETEFFLQEMCGCALQLEFKWYLSAFLSAARTTTLTLQRFEDAVPGFAAWYGPHQRRLAGNRLARSFLQMRNEHIHGGPYPIRGSMCRGRTVEHYFQLNTSGKAAEVTTLPHIVQASTEYFLQLLEIVYDCYAKLGVHFDPQQYYTKEHYPGNIDTAECEIHGWICTPLIEEGYTQDDRWHELRGHVAECTINHLFLAYLNRITPQPIEPDHYADFAFSEEDKGWTHIPAGYSSVEDYHKNFRRTM
jgi:hypothetical protein